MTTPNELKAAAARAALVEVRSGMILGLGSGSTAGQFVRQLGESLRRGELRDLKAVGTSRNTEDLARGAGIEVITLEDAGELELTVDGADEIDAQLRLIKGLGGALLREKIVEQASRRFIVIADESKMVERLGRGKLPIEVVQFAAKHLFNRFQALGLKPEERLHQSEPFVTDEGHRIIDVRVPPSTTIELVVGDLRAMAGVVETGFFPDEATEAIIAWEEGIRRIIPSRPPGCEL